MQPYENTYEKLLEENEKLRQVIEQLNVWLFFNTK